MFENSSNVNINGGYFTQLNVTQQSNEGMGLHIFLHSIELIWFLDMQGIKELDNTSAHNATHRSPGRIIPKCHPEKHNQVLEKTVH